jgi:Fe-S-cluster containining protein
MNMNQNHDAVRKYRQLRDEVDRKGTELEKMHADQMECQKGCCDCCMNLSVWPVEFYSILEEMKAADWPKPALNEDKKCGYLAEQGGCRIYPFRPIICRTHGLPLVYWHDETEPPDYGVMFCQHNFKAADDIPFGADNTLNMDEINEKLAQINIAFLEERQDLNLDMTTRVELKKLLDYL